MPTHCAPAAAGASQTTSARCIRAFAIAGHRHSFDPTTTLGWLSLPKRYHHRRRSHGTLRRMRAGVVGNPVWTVLRNAALAVLTGLAVLAVAGSAAPEGPIPAPGRCVEVVYEGKLDLEGHYARPGDTRRYRSRQRFLAGADAAVRLDWTTWSEGDSA